MEEIKYNYNGSGVKTLRIGGMIAMFTSVIGGLIVAFGIAVSLMSVITGFVVIAAGFVSLGVCNALATIAENALFKTKLMMHKLEKEGISFKLEEVEVKKDQTKEEEDKSAQDSV